jgi:hypothetical protein
MDKEFFDKNLEGKIAEQINEIIDWYAQQGLTGEELRKALGTDKTYQKLKLALKKMRKKRIASLEEEKRYPLDTKLDLNILSKIHEAESLELSENERFLISFIRTQLEEDWRGPLLAVLDTILKNKNLGPEERWREVLKTSERFWRP